MQLLKGRLCPRSSRSIITPLYDKRQPVVKNYGDIEKNTTHDRQEKECFRFFSFIFWEESFQSSRWPFHIRLKSHIKGFCSLHSQMILNERLYGVSGGVAPSQHFCNLQLPHKDVGILCRTFPLIQYRKKLLETPVSTARILKMLGQLQIERRYEAQRQLNYLEDEILARCILPIRA